MNLGPHLYLNMHKIYTMPCISKTKFKVIHLMGVAVTESKVNCSILAERERKKEIWNYITWQHSFKIGRLAIFSFFSFSLCLSEKSKERAGGRRRRRRKRKKKKSLFSTFSWNLFDQSSVQPSTVSKKLNSRGDSRMEKDHKNKTKNKKTLNQKTTCNL